MKTSLLTPNKDPMGCAIADYYEKGKAGKLRVFSSQFDEDEIPVSQLFRTFDEMPELEQESLRLAEGKILDCGAGSGCHALALQDMGKDVEAIDISPRSVEVMQQRGVKHAYCINLFDENYLQKFDTILMLMNGSGIIGKLENMSAFFTKMKQLLNPGGCIYMDSSDLRYLFEDEDGSFLSIIGECLEVYIEPVECFSLDLLVLHLEIDFAIITSGKVYQETAVFIFEEVAKIG